VTGCSRPPDVRPEHKARDLLYSVVVKNELAATDASQGGHSQAGPEAAPGSASGPAPFAARLEVTLWVITEFQLCLPASPQIKNQKSKIKNRIQ